MKHFKKALLATSLVFVLSACGIHIGGGPLDWAKLKNGGTGISLMSDKVSNAKLSFDKKTFEEAMEKADEAAVKQKSVYTFSGEFSRVNTSFSNLREKLTIARAIYQAEGSSSAKDTYNELYDTYLSFFIWYYPFLLHVRDSSNDIYNAFFGDMDKTDVNDYIKSFTYNEKTKQLDTDITELQDTQEEKYNEFIKGWKAGTIEKDDPAYVAYMSDALTRFRSVLTKGNEYAAVFGYKNYFDYVYKNYYSRDYKIDFVDTYYPLVDEYIIPMINYYNSNVDKSILNDPAKKEFINKYYSSNIADASCFQGDALDSYIAAMGGEMETTYNHLKKDGYYVFSNNENSLGTAYVSSGADEPLIFFSKNYQGVTTIAHEFGHYFANYTNDYINSFPFDIQETHSQANEMLFNSYLTTYYAEDANLDCYKYIKDSSVYEMLTGVIAPIAVAQVESYIFNNLSLSNDELLAGINTIMNKYDGMVYSAYWATPIVSSTGYYISYATSGVGALGAYIKAEENFNSAKESYFKLVGYPEETQNINAIFSYSGFYSPLQESTFQKLTPSALFSF